MDNQNINLQNTYQPSNQQPLNSPRPLTDTPSQQVANTQTSGRNKHASRKIVFILVAIALGLIFSYIGYMAGIGQTTSSYFQTYTSSGSTMSPSIISGEKVTVVKNVLPTVLLTLNINDIVIYKAPDFTAPVLGRIVALAGDHVIINNCKLTVIDKNNPNGIDPSAAYIPSNVCTGGKADLVIPNGEVYILGDNRMIAQDSRVFGPIKVADVLGKVIGTQ